MRETDLHFFIDSTANYFLEMTGEAAVTGIPHLKGDDPLVLDYSGIIGISGKRKGSIYITANEDMLKALTKHILGLDEVSTEDIKDLIGEIANTISGNGDDLPTTNMEAGFDTSKTVILAPSPM